MAVQNWKFVLAAVSALLSLSAVVLVLPALTGAVGWTSVIAAGALAAVTGTVALLSDGGEHHS
ncbi:hypothetical protein G3I60_38505 [Streptomyces sp. SID13666]|uniref:hypothetical protein n=1 Tax=unclassified Streptomyces TaxID=2593676 RepID=UPI0013BEBDC4|nr:MULTISPECIES: hypothetical protein [unclassified Streptomyces]NEA59892.1 hypothetical protein [Streptomyces sp. SID13666]NEA76134.1 hypothetical protein [Streptomyces sp. SID13588]